MGPVSSPSLAIAVAAAGGLGTVPASGVPAQRLETLLSDLTSRATGVLAANFLTRSIDRDAVQAAASRLGIVDFFWSDPDPALVNIAHEARALVSWQVGSVAEAQAAADAGCDFVVVQGTEAGGHVRGLSRRYGRRSVRGRPDGSAAKRLGENSWRVLHRLHRSHAHVRQ